MKRDDMRRVLFLATILAGCVIALGAWWWLTLPGKVLNVGGSAFSSFEVPDHLDVSEFTERLTSVGFVAVHDADFDSLLPRKYHGSAVAPGKPASDLKTVQAYSHRDNTDSMTRLIGLDVPNRRVHYFRSQVLSREKGEGQLVGNVVDTMEEELRK